MNIRAIGVDMKIEGDRLVPSDEKLRPLIEDYCSRELAESVKFEEHRRTIACVELDENNEPIAVHGIGCGEPVWDWSVVRFTKQEAGDVLFARMHSYLEDQGMRNQKCLVYVADHEDKESRCPFWRKFLRKEKAVKASRWAVKI